jgi:S1-C subfamily serine protease
MRQLTSFLTGLIFIQCIHAQTNPLTEPQVKEYLISQIAENYDPIIGIYTIKKTEYKSVAGREVTTSDNKDNNKYAIARKGPCFVLFYVPNGESMNSMLCDISPTSNPEVYLFHDFKFRMNSDGNFERGRTLTPTEIAEATKLSLQDVVKFNLKITVVEEWIKIFPTAWEVEQLINEEESKKEKTASTGTGFAITSSGLIATNYHVVEGANSINVKGINKDFYTDYKAAIVVTDPKNDLAIIRIDDSRFHGFEVLPYTLRRNTADVGENIFVLGYPLTATMGEEVKLTNGIISSRTGFKGDVSMYQISAPVQPGNSGGPLFDFQGNVAGIVSAKHANAENASYAIKINYLINLIDMITPAPTLPVTNNISQKTLPEKVKVLSNFVYIITKN